MITIHKIINGKDIPFAGVCAKDLVTLDLPQTIAIQPPDFKGLRPKLLISIGDPVKVGTPILQDRTNPKIIIVSPASGTITAINRGERRSILEIIITLDHPQDHLTFKSFSSSDLDNLSAEAIIDNLTKSGLWPLIRQRPFSCIANPDTRPKSIFVRAMSTDPLAIDVDTILHEKQALFQMGLDLLSTLTTGETHLCIGPGTTSRALLEARNVKIHQFVGPHPTGNISTHIHSIDPIQKGDIVWYINALDVLKIAELFLHGRYITETYVAVSGEGLTYPTYVKTIPGASIAQLIKDRGREGDYRFISGSIYSGRDVGRNGYLGFYDSQISVIPRGGKRKLLGWLTPGMNRFSLSKTFLSAFMPKKNAPIDTDLNGSPRAIVFNHVYDDYNTLDILTFFLIRAILSRDLEEAEQLGLLECDEEDFALATIACPSKVDIGNIIREGLDLIASEG